MRTVLFIKLPSYKKDWPVLIKKIPAYAIGCMAAFWMIERVIDFGNENIIWPLLIKFKFMPLKNTDLVVFALYLTIFILLKLTIMKQEQLIQ